MGSRFTDQQTPAAGLPFSHLLSSKDKGCTEESCVYLDSNTNNEKEKTLSALDSSDKQQQILAQRILVGYVMYALHVLYQLCSNIYALCYK